MHLTFSEIANVRTGLTASEAVSLLLAAAHEMKRTAGGDGMALPPADRILLGTAGDVSFVYPFDATAGDAAAAGAALLRRLLKLDDRASAKQGQPMPGPLALLMARAAREIDLPVPAYREFLDALERYGRPDPAVLASIHARCVAPHVAPRAQADQPHPARRGTMATSAAAAAALIGSLGLWIAFGSSHASPSPENVSRASRDLAEPPDVEYATPDETAPILAPPGRSPETAHSSSPPRVSAGSSIVSAGPLLSSSIVGADVFSPSFAPHGHDVLFHAGRTGAALMRASIDGSGHVEFTTLLRDGWANHHAAISPDGSQLAFDSDRDGTRGVYVARPDASGATKVSGDGYAAVPRWSPDGRRLAFIKAESKRPKVWNVWIADLDAHTLSRVSHHAVGQAWGGSWFPDGQRLAYSVEDTLIIANLANGTVEVLRSPRPNALIRTPAVSPDGRWIVFQVFHDGVWLLNVQTLTMRRVLEDPAAEEFAWSPDSTHVAYHTQRRHAWSVWQLQLRPAAAG